MKKKEFLIIKKSNSFVRLLKVTLFLSLLSICVNSAMAGELFVSSTTGANSNDGSKAKPFKNIEKALKLAKKGDIIRVAEGNYYGLRGKGYLEVPLPVQLIGGYSTDFSKRDVLKHRTLIQPDNASAAKSRKALLTFKKSIKGDKIVVDGIIFDMGMRNSYSDTKGKPEGCETGMLLLPPQSNKAKKQKPTVTEQCIYFPSTGASGDVLIQNCVFINSAKYGIQGGHKQGNFQLLNNVFVSNRMAAIEIYGVGGKKGPKGPTEKDGNVEIANNTILFSWSRTKDFKDMGYGARVMTKVSYDIHNNIFGLNVLTGVDNTRFNKPEWMKLDNNLFMLNKQGDMMHTDPGQGQLERVGVSDFADFDFASVKNNTGKVPNAFPINKAYLEGFLSARYSEEVDYNPDSPANVLREVMGLNKQGKLKTKVSMYANRYPLEDALKLFGALKNVGAQKPKMQ
jgi:hypothetical protein